MIRVAILTTSFPMQPSSSSGIFVERMVSSLPASSIEAHVITPCSPRGLIKREGATYSVSCFRYAPRRWQILAHEPGGIPVAVTRKKVLMFLIPVFLLSMFGACLKARSKFDVIHANWSVNGVIAGLAGMVTGIPVVTTLRGDDVVKASKSKLFKLALRLCVMLSKRVVVVSEAIHYDLIQNYPTHKKNIQFLANGVDQSFYSIKKDGSKDQIKEGINILSVGSLIPRKGVKCLIEALSLVNEESASFNLNVIGEGVERESLERLASSLGVEKKVRFLGAMRPDEVAKYFGLADIFVLASHSEGRPNVMLESMASGVPVIASRIDGVTELVTDGVTGLLFSVGDSDDLARQITKLMTDPCLRKKIGRNGRDLIVESRLFWPDVGMKYAAVYEQIVSNAVEGLG